MAQVIRSGSHEQDCNRTVLPPPWQRDGLSHHLNHTNNNKKRKLDIVKKNVNTSRNESSTSHITTNKFAILESTDNSMDVVETLINQHAQKSPPPHRSSSMNHLRQSISSTFK